VLVCRRIGREVPWTGDRDVWWHEAIATQPRTYETERTSPEDPYMVIYTSGTTGRPKGAVHVHGGFPIKGAQDMAHCFDVQERDVIFWFTDMGWMMGPWLFVGALTLGATAFCYEGSPDYPRPDRVWDMVERHGITVLGISPTAIRALIPLGTEWVTCHDLSSLRVLGGTGEPWNPEPWSWYFRHVGGGRCPIVNYSGGTEISGGITGCNTIRPLKVCSFVGPIPGMAADVVDEHGEPVRGAVGELIIRGPWPGMTRGFWNDPERYEATYWSRWPGVWVHGDWALVDEDGFWFIQGRSDDTIKIAGKRLGPAEVESAVVDHPAVAEAAAIGVPHPLKGESVVVFAVLRPGREPSDALREEIKDTVAAALGKPLRPDDVRFAADLPKTRNAKIMRRVIRARHLGQSELGDLSGLDNPAAIEAIARAR
jgi:acetyl-CoA synthetase